MSQELLAKMGQYSLKPDPRLKEQIVYEFSNMTYQQLQDVFDSALHSNERLHSDLAGPLTDEMEKRQMSGH